MATFYNQFTVPSNPFLAGGSAPASSPINPGPQPGSYNPTFGGIPGALSLPNPFGDLSSAYPNLGGTNAAVSGDIYSQLQGQLSPGTQNALQNAAASWGVGTGMTGNSPLALNKGLANVAGFAEGQVNSGLQNYGRIIPAISQTQTVNPALQAEIAARNAAVNAAPNPTYAATYAQSLFDKYLQSLRGPGGGTGNAGVASPTGGTGTSGSGALGFGFGSLGTYNPNQIAGGGDAVLGTTPDQASQINDLFNSSEFGDASGGLGSYDDMLALGL